MTLADKLRKEGIKEGMKEGIRKELEETISVQLNKKLAVEELTQEISNKIKKLDIERLRQIRDNIFEINSFDDLEKYIN